MNDSNNSFSDYSSIRKYFELSFTTKYDRLLSFCHQLNQFRNLDPQTEKTKNKKNRVYKNAVNLYNTLLAIYFNYYNNITDEEKEEMDKNIILIIYFLNV